MIRHISVILGLIVLFAFSGNIAQASTSKLNASFKYDGQTLRTGPHKGYDVFTHASVSDDAAVLAISPDGKWLFVWSDSGDGWAPRGSMTVDGDHSELAIWNRPMRGYTFKPEGSMMRATDLKMGANAAYSTITCVPPEQYVKVLAQSDDSHWLFIWSDAGDGWVPRSAVSVDADLTFLSIWAKPIGNATMIR